MQPFIIAGIATLIPGVFSQAQDLVAVLDSYANLSTLHAYLTKYPDYYATFASQQDVTILAPSNDAFDKLPFSNLGPAFEDYDNATIQAVLDYHIAQMLHPTTSLNGSFQFIPTLLTGTEWTNITNGQRIGMVGQAGGDVVISSGLGSRSTITTADIPYNGGWISIIDSFLEPPQNFSMTAPQFNLTGMYGAVIASELEDTFDYTPMVTIFAPDNDAFENIGTGLESMTVEDLGSVLEYHLVNGTVGYSSVLFNDTVLQTVQGSNLTFWTAGNSIYVNSAQLIQQDILLANGVMHVIDNVLDPNDTPALPNPAIPTQPPVLSGSLVQNIPFISAIPNTVSVASSGDIANSGTVSATGTGLQGVLSSATTLTSEPGSAATSTFDDYSFTSMAAATVTGSHEGNAPAHAKVDFGVAMVMLAVAAIMAS